MSAARPGLPPRRGARDEEGASMGFTVTRPGGTRDRQLQAYARLLRQRGVDLGRLPRVRDPMTDKHWLYLWDTRAEAQAYADELTAG